MNKAAHATGMPRVQDSATMEEVWLQIFSHCIIFSSCSDDFNIKVLQAFVELHEFADLNLVQALR